MSVTQSRSQTTRANSRHPNRSTTDCACTTRIAVYTMRSGGRTPFGVRKTQLLQFPRAYRTDIGRFFVIDSAEADGQRIDWLKDLAAQIRTDFPNVALAQIHKSAITIVE